MKKLSSIEIIGGLTVGQSTVLSGTVEIGSISTGTYSDVLVRNSSNQMLYRGYSDFVNDVSTSLNLSSYVPTSRTLTINGTTYDLSADRSWTITSTETDTLDSVTTRGNTTPNTIDIGGSVSDYYTLDTTATPTPTQGMIYWDSDRSTAAIQMNGVEARLGQDGFWYVKNQTGSTIDKGTAVMAVGALGASSRILVAPMVADGTVDEQYVLGITAEDILDGDDGFVMHIGKIRGIDTTQYGLAAGQILYCDPNTPGALTITQPSAPDLNIPIAFTVDYKTNGTLAVRALPGNHLDELHDVYTNSVANGDILVYNSTNSRWENSPAPTLDSVTDAGNTTTNAITVGGLTVDTDTLYVDSTNNRVGIGTISPDQKLHVSGNTKTTNLYVAGDIIHDGDVDTKIQFNTDIINFDTAGVERVRITASGGVGIGTSSPAQKLEVIGNIKAGAGAADNYVQSIFSDGTETRMHGYGLYMSRTASYIRPTNDNTQALYIGTDSKQWSSVSIDATTTLFNVNGSEKMRITSGGNVGIGATNPLAALHINKSGVPQLLLDGGSNTTGDIVVPTGEILQIGHWDSSTSTYTDRLRITSSGNVGIGSTSPTRTLSVEGTAYVRDNFAVSLTNPGTDSTKDSEIYLQSKGNQSGTTRSSQWYLQTESDSIYGNSAFRIAKNYDGGSTNEYLRITSSGNVGIGTTNPIQKLQVAGSAYVNGGTLFLDTDQFLKWGNSNQGIKAVNDSNMSFYTGGSEKMTLNSSGNLGIGTTSPYSNVTFQYTGNNSAGTYYGNLVLNATNSNTWNRLRFDRNGVARFGVALSYEDKFVISNLYTNGTTADPDDTAFVILQNSNVGIGTTSPIAKQHNVITSNGTALLLNNTSGGSGEYVDLDFNTYNTSLANYANAAASIRVIDDGLYSGHITFRTKGSTIGASQTERMRIDSSGNVGIGTTNPTAKLRIAAPANDGILLESNNALLGNTGTGYTQLIYWNGSDMFYGRNTTGVPGGSGGVVDNHLFRTNGATRMQITSAGNVGIGTTAPISKLDVTGAGYFSGESLSSGLDQTYTNIALLIDEGDYIYTKDSSTTLRKLIGKAADVIYIGQTGTSLIDGIVLQPGTTNGYVSFYDDNSEYARFQGGNLGIGTTSPDAPLTVTNNTVSSYIINVNMADDVDGGGFYEANGGMELYLKDTSGTGQVKLTSSGSSYLNGGNVGIGTSSPVATLEVEAASTINGTELAISNGYGESEKSITFRNDSDIIGQISTYGRHSTTGAGPAMTFDLSNGTSAVERLRITKDGNVGIGTTSPSQKLEVNGNALVSNLYLGGNSFTRLSSDGSGEVGINYNNSATTTYGFSVYNGATSRVFGVLRATGATIVGSSTHRGGKLQVNDYNSTDDGIRIYGYNDNEMLSLISRYDQANGGLFFKRGANGSESTIGEINWTSNQFRINAEIGSLALMTGGSTSVSINSNQVVSLSAGLNVTAGSINMGTNIITDTKVGQWDTAYSWGDHSTQSYATQSYVNTAVSNLVDSAPSTLDTLNELAAALGDDPNFATTVTNSIATKLPLSGGTMTGIINTNSNISFSQDSTGVEFYSVNSLKKVAGRGMVLEVDTSRAASSYLEILQSGTYYFFWNSNQFSITDVSNWNTAYSWGDHSGQYLPINGGTVGGPVTINGSLVVNGTITENSSLRVKENIITSDGHLEKVNKLRPVKYNKINSDKTEIGLIAEEVEEVYPEFIQYDENGDPIGIHYSRLTASLIGAVKELTKEVEELKSKING